MEYSRTDGTYRVSLRSTVINDDMCWVLHVDRQASKEAGVEEWIPVADIRTSLPLELSFEEATPLVRRIADTLIPMVDFADETDFERYAQHVAQTIHRSTFGLDVVTLEARVSPSNARSGQVVRTHAPLGLSLSLYRLIARGALTQAGILGGDAKISLAGKVYDL